MINYNSRSSSSDKVDVYVRFLIKVVLMAILQWSLRGFELTTFEDTKLSYYHIANTSSVNM